MASTTNRQVNFFLGYLKTDHLRMRHKYIQTFHLKKFRNHFVNLLQDRRVNKIYKALIVGKVIGSFEITDAIGRDKNNRTKMSVRVDGKDAHTFVKLDKNLGSYSLLDVSIKTGRTHQIRVHLSSKKLPIIGDKTYNPSSNIAKGTPKVLTDMVQRVSIKKDLCQILNLLDMFIQFLKSVLGSNVKLIAKRPSTVIFQMFHGFFNTIYALFKLLFCQISVYKSTAQFHLSLEKYWHMHFIINHSLC